MARLMTYKEAYSLMNQIVKQATGQTELAVIDSSSFVSAGETVLATGTENTLNALSIVMGRTLMAVRPYQAKLMILQAINTAMFTSRLRKVSFYSQDAKATGWLNTDENPKNLYDKYTNDTNPAGGNVGSMWEQQKPAVLEMNFGGSSTWDFQVTIYEEQLRAAFRSESEFIALVNGIMTQKANDIEYTKEQFNRMNLLNYIAGVYDMSTLMPGSVVNLTAEYNTKYGTSYTSEQLRTTYLESFLKFFVARFKLASDYMEERTALYHWSPEKVVDGVTYNKILRHTPKSAQRCFLYQPLFTEATANVLPTIFNPQYLAVENYEPVTFWQNQQNRALISVTPAIPDPATGSQKAGAEVDNLFVVGVLFDKDAIMTDFQFESANSTPIEARKKYRNVWYHNVKNAINDFTENGIIFIMKD